MDSESGGKTQSAFQMTKMSPDTRALARTNTHTDTHARTRTHTHARRGGEWEREGWTEHTYQGEQTA